MSTTRIARHAGTAALGFVLIMLVLAIAFSGCAAQHQLTPQRPPKSDVVGLLSTPTTAGATASTAPFEAEAGYLAPPLGFDVKGKTKAQSERKASRILRRWRKQFQHDARQHTKATPLTDNNVIQSMPRKCKGCTLVYGTATVAGKKATVAAGDNAVASHIEKRAGPAVVGSDSVSQNTVGTGNQATINGDGNTTTQTKADVEPPGVGATIAGAIATPLGKVLALLVAGGVVWGIVAWRKKKAVQNLV
jgi:hypothetical protein